MKNHKTRRLANAQYCISNAEKWQARAIRAAAKGRIKEAKVYSSWTDSDINAAEFWLSIVAM